MIAEDMKALIEAADETYQPSEESHISKVIYLEDKNIVIFILYRRFKSYIEEHHFAKVFYPDKVSTYCFFRGEDAWYEVVAVDNDARVKANPIDEVTDEDGRMKYLVVCENVQIRRFTSHRDLRGIPPYMNIYRLEHI